MNCFINLTSRFETGDTIKSEGLTVSKSTICLRWLPQVSWEVFFLGLSKISFHFSSIDDQMNWLEIQTKQGRAIRALTIPPGPTVLKRMFDVKICGVRNRRSDVSFLDRCFYLLLWLCWFFLCGGLEWVWNAYRLEFLSQIWLHGVRLTLVLSVEGEIKKNGLKKWSPRIKNNIRKWRAATSCLPSLHCLLFKKNPLNPSLTDKMQCGKAQWVCFQTNSSEGIKCFVTKEREEKGFGRYR